jgi:hypothetical protein
VSFRQVCVAEKMERRSAEDGFGGVHVPHNPAG